MCVRNSSSFLAALDEVKMTRRAISLIVGGGIEVHTRSLSSMQVNACLANRETECTSAGPLLIPLATAAQ